jgi:hypothetical protein
MKTAVFSMPSSRWPCLVANNFKLMYLRAKKLGWIDSWILHPLKNESCYKIWYCKGLKWFCLIHVFFENCNFWKDHIWLIIDFFFSYYFLSSNISHTLKILTQTGDLASTRTFRKSLAMDVKIGASDKLCFQ